MTALPTPQRPISALQAQAEQLLEQAKTLLFPHVWSRDKREALLLEAFYPAHVWILEQIEIDGSAADFLPRCWHILHQGAGDGSLNGRLLNALKTRYGHDRQQELDNLIQQWAQLCQTLPAAQREAPWTPIRQPVLNGADQPTLFLSYADRDAKIAQRLAAALAEYGHACHLERAPKIDNNAWLAATAAGLGNAYAVLLLIGEQTVHDRWQRLEYLAAADRQKQIIPLRLSQTATIPPHIEGAPLPLPVDAAAFQQAWDEGARWSLEEAVAYGLG